MILTIQNIKISSLNPVVYHNALNPMELEVVREPYLAQRILLVDGIFGCGKTMLSPIVGALERVELLAYSYPIEYTCALLHLGKLSVDAATVLIRMYTDVQLYDTMMSREVNFRPSDLSSVFKSSHPFRYLRRLFQEGDAAVPAQIKKERPILHLTTHNLLTVAEPLFAALGNRLVFVEVIRHPLYMLKQQMLNMERLHGDVRDFTVYIKYANTALPFFVQGWQEQYRKANAVDRAIYYMEHMGERIAKQTDRFKREDRYLITVPFERFVLEPWPYLQEIIEHLETRATPLTHRMLRKQNVPRTRIADGINLGIYRYCGWEPPEKNSSERDELVKRREFAVRSGVTSEALSVLDRLSAEYEKKYMSDLV